MKNEVARIIQEQQARGDNQTLQSLRALAGYSLESVQHHTHTQRHREVIIHRDQFGRVIGTTEHYVEVENTDTSAQWLK